MLDRNTIINFLKEFSEKKDYVNAMWLEGADGIDAVDEYSDIDFWFDTDKHHQKSFLLECIEALKKLGNIDTRMDNIREEIAQSNIHLDNTSEYLKLDICVQSNEIRGKEGTCYIKNDIAEVPLVIFDKNNIITYKENYNINLAEIKSIFESNKHRIVQMSRVKKYIHRNQYLEAYSKYIENIANSLVIIARLIYTPRHYSYKLCHINNHLPKEFIKQLEPLYKVTNFENIKNNLTLAKSLLEEYEKKINEKYNF